jgi:hypothetical protein
MRRATQNDVMERKDFIALTSGMSGNKAVLLLLGETRVGLAFVITHLCCAQTF